MTANGRGSSTANNRSNKSVVFHILHDVLIRLIDALGDHILNELLKALLSTLDKGTFKCSKPNSPDEAKGFASRTKRREQRVSKFGSSRQGTDRRSSCNLPFCRSILDNTLCGFASAVLRGSRHHEARTNAWNRGNSNISSN